MEARESGLRPPDENRLPPARPPLGGGPRHGRLQRRVGTPALRLLRLRDPGPLAAGASGRLACADTVLYDTGCWLRRTGRGTYRYQGRWQTLDHIVVSGSLLNGARPLRAASRLAVFDAGFLLETDRSSFGRKPFRTYAGPRYLGGYSDHLPVYIELSFGK